MHKISVIAKPSDNNDDLDCLGVQQILITRAAGAQVGAILGSIRLGSLALSVGLSSLLIPGIGQAVAVESILATSLEVGLLQLLAVYMARFKDGWCQKNKQECTMTDLTREII